MPKAYRSKGGGSFTLVLVRVERGLRRIALLVSAFIWVSVAAWVYWWAVFKPFYDWREEIRLAQGMTVRHSLTAFLLSVGVGAIAATAPWLVFVVGRWVVRGFQEDR